MSLDRPLIVIRERSQVDLFDLALVVIRRRPAPLCWALVCGVAPFVIGNAWLFRIGGDRTATLGLFLWWFEAPLASAPLTLVLGRMMFGEVPSPRQVLTRMLGSAGLLLGTHGVLRFIPFFWLPPRLLFANEVLLLEQGRWLKLWRRGGSLMIGREGELFLLALVQFLANWMVAYITYVGVGRLSQALLAEPMTWDLVDSTVFTSLSFQIPLWVGAAYFTVVRFLTYIDQRIRLEGWEVELRLRAAGQAFAETRRW